MGNVRGIGSIKLEFSFPRSDNGSWDSANHRRHWRLAFMHSGPAISHVAMNADDLNVTPFVIQYGCSAARGAFIDVMIVHDETNPETPWSDSHIDSITAELGRRFYAQLGSDMNRERAYLAEIGASWDLFTWTWLERPETHDSRTSAAAVG